MSSKEKSTAAKFLAKMPQIRENFTAFRSDVLANFSPSTNTGVLGESPMNLYESLRHKLKKITIDGDELYIVEGDTLLDEAQLEIYALHKEAVNRAHEFDKISDLAGLGKISLSGESERGLIGITEGGKIVRWQPGTVLTYCVLQHTFTNNANYTLVRDNFKKATEAWEETCGIKFDYKPEFDSSTKTDASAIGVVFIVRELDAGGDFIAASFFPNDPTFRRRVFIDPTYYGSGNFDKIGVLRHELGHILGFRHEHIRSVAPVNCPDEDLDDVIDLTQYDSKSVMHYLCGGVGDPALKITALDKIGAQRVYGPPLNLLAFVS